MLELAYLGSVKSEEELEGEAAFAGWGSLPGIGGGFIASGRFCFF